MRFIDSHAHLYLEQFKEDIKQVIEEAILQGVDTFILPNIDRSSIGHMKTLVSAYPMHCYATIGVHPCSIHTDTFQQELHKVAYGLTDYPHYVAIGEIGIDLYWDKTFLKEQIIAFERQLDLAQTYQLPVIIHTRDSMEETISVISQFPKVKGVFHCFSGSQKQAEIVIDKGFKVGIGGVVTYKNSPLAEIVSRLPLSSLVLETDAPFLPPVPFRGKRNDPKYIPIIAQKIAELKQMSLEEIADITTKNSMDLFQLPIHKKKY